MREKKDTREHLFATLSSQIEERFLDTDQWLQLNESVRDAYGKSDDGVIDKQEAAKQYDTGLNLAIREKLYICRGQADSEIKRDDEMIAASVPIPKKKDFQD